MISGKHKFFFSFVIILSTVLSACASSQQAEPVQPTVLPTIKPTNTAKPTPKPRPTPSADVAATEAYSDIQTYFDEGYISTSDGIMYRPGDFDEKWAQMGWYQWWNTGRDMTHFVFSAHYEWSSALETADVSGCGFVFAIQPNRQYAVFLDRKRIYFTNADASGFWSIGKTRGTGRVNFGNPAEADFALVVEGPHAFVFVDDEFIGEYSLSVDQPLKGEIAYSLLSGTNKDYGTECKITNARLWKIK